MRTDDLIAALAADATPEPALAARAWLVPAAVALTAALMVVTLGLRAGLGAALADPLIAAKTVLPALVALGAGWVALRLARPGARAGWPARAHWLVQGVAVGLVAAPLAGNPAADWPALLLGDTLVACLVTVPVLSALPFAAGLAVLRRGATTRPALAGAALGLASGGMAAALYSLHCTEDNPLFYVTWYGTGIAIVGLAGWLAGPRLLRW